MNLPTSVISAEALQAGYDYDANAGPRVKTKKPIKTTLKKRQRNKPLIDPSVGISITVEGRLVIEQGAEDSTMQVNSAINGTGEFLMSDGNGVFPAPGGLSANVSTYNPSLSDQLNFFSRAISTISFPYRAEL